MQKKQTDERKPNTPADLRRELSRLPGWSQPFWTWLTGRPLAGAGPGGWTPWRYVALVLALLGSSAAAGLAAIEYGQPLLYLGSWAIAVAGARRAQAVVVHQAAHEQLSGNARVDRLMRCLLSLLLLLEEGEAYTQGHIVHHSKKLSTEADPTVRTLERAGIRRGRSKAVLWVTLVSRWLDPFWHAHVSWARVGSHFAAWPLWKPAAMTVVLMLVAGLCLSLGVGAAYWLAGFLVLYNVSTLIRLCVEHIPVPTGIRSSYIARNTEICLGTAPPSSGSLRGWLGFLVGTAAATFLRCFVLVADTAGGHGAHHVFGGRRDYDWPNWIHAREAASGAHLARGGEPLLEIVGLFQAIDTAFEVLSGTTVAGSVDD